MKLNAYQKTALTTVGAVIFLIFVGGLVRAAGAGLGCPDWPRCFGMWIPPTSAAELPPGFDASQFNVWKTWTEYINRLVGVVIGLLITTTFLLSLRYRKENPAVVWSSAAAFVLVLFQGWLGGRVVETGLDEWLITLHMMLAMLIMLVLIYAVFRAMDDRLDFSFELSSSTWRKLYGISLAVLLLTIAQMVLGTQVREAVDVIKNAGVVPPRDEWISMIGSVDEIHRTFSWTLFLSGGYLYWLTGWKTHSRLLSRLGIAIFGVILMQIGLGAGLYYLGMPPAFQVLHLTGIAIMVALEFLLVMVLRSYRLHST